MSIFKAPVLEWPGPAKMDHLGTGQVRFSDGYCIAKMAHGLSSNKNFINKPRFVPYALLFF
jgi:hypothetical protein